MSTTDEQREAEDAIVELMDEHLWTTGTDVEGKAKCARAILARELASESTAPVDARDANVAALQECIAYAETGSMRGKPVGWHRDMIRAATKALAAIARQAAAPAEGEA